MRKYRDDAGDDDDDVVERKLRKQPADEKL